MILRPFDNKDLFLILIVIFVICTLIIVIPSFIDLYKINLQNVVFYAIIVSFLIEHTINDIIKIVEKFNKIN